MSFTDEIVAYTTDAACGSDASREVTTTAIIDTVAVAVAGSAEPLLRQIRKTLPVDGGTHTLWGSNERRSVGGAVFYNAAAAHALDFDDMSESVRGHLSSVIIPALYAAMNDPAVDADAAAERFSDAFAVAAQVAGAVGAGVSLRAHYQRGWHSTSTLGVIAAAAGIARLLHLSEVQTRNAIGIAASSSSGIRQNFGTATKVLHVANAATDAVRAATLARAGVDADPDALGGPNGFLEVYGAPADPSLGLDVLHGPSLLESPGINVKLLPCCYELQRSAFAALDIAKRVPTKVDSIRLVVNLGATEPLTLRYPTTARESQFSPAYVIASALVHGHLDLATFTENALSDARVRAVAEFVDVVEAPGPPTSEFIDRFAWLNVNGESGSAQTLIREAPGSAVIGVTTDELTRKVRDCLAVTGRTALEPDLVAAAHTLAQGGSSRALTAVLDEFGQPAAQRADSPKGTPTYV